LGLVVAASSVLAPRLVPAPVAAPPTVRARSTGSPAVTRSAAATPSAVSSSPRPAFRAIRIAATDPANDLINVETIDCPTCASGSRVQYVGQGHALIVRIQGVPAPGRRSLVIVYETDGTRPLDVIVNGGDTVSLQLPGKGSWITPARYSLPIMLPAGDSEIKFFHASAPAPDLDQFLIK
jgi:hypothetical protein